MFNCTYLCLERLKSLFNLPALLLNVADLVGEIKNGLKLSVGFTTPFNFMKKTGSPTWISKTVFAANSH